MLNRRNKAAHRPADRHTWERGITPIGVIHEDASIAMSWLAGTPLETTSTMEDIETILRNLEAAESTS